MAFQKTCTSGRVINVNSNLWCSTVGIGENFFYFSTPSPPCSNHVETSSLIAEITQNMIDLLLVHDETNHSIFANPAPTSFVIKPSESNVSYKACQNGSIDIRPGGVYVYCSTIVRPNFLQS
jgi:hypothetical protein